MMTVAATVDRFLDCFASQRLPQLGELYRDDARFELWVGDHHERRTGPEAIVAHYVADFDPPPTFLRWAARPASWGAVVEGDALQPDGAGHARFRWVHVLTIGNGLIITDTVHCTGAIPVSGPGAASAGTGRDRGTVTPAGPRSRGNGGLATDGLATAPERVVRSLTGRARRPPDASPGADVPVVGPRRPGPGPRSRTGTSHPTPAVRW